MNAMCNLRRRRAVRIVVSEAVTLVLLLIAQAGCHSSTTGATSTTAPLLTDFRQGMSVPPPPTRMTQGQSFLLEGVTVRNTGQQIWQARGNNQVELTYDWLNRDGKFVQHGSVTVLPADVQPGQSASLVATIVAPEAPGHYIIRFTMIAEKIAWFSNMGGGFVDYPVEVVLQ